MPRDADKIRDLSPGVRRRLSLTTPTSRRRIPTPRSRSTIRTPELEDNLRCLRRDATPFDLDNVLPFLLPFPEDDAGQPDFQDGAVGGHPEEEPLGGILLQRIPVEGGEEQGEEKKQKRRKKEWTEEEMEMALLRRSGLRSAKKGKRGEGGEEEEKE